MKNTDWDKDQIRILAGSSGKPLEVECAQAFLAPPKSEWKVELGSYYQASEHRELDILAVREEELPGAVGLTCRLRALVSCKGFPLARSPIAYSVSDLAVPSPSPVFLCEHRGPLNAIDQTYGPLPDIGASLTNATLERVGLASTRPLVAFDTFERVESDAKPAKPNKPARDVTVTYKRAADQRSGRRGDSELYAAIDSALNASIYWAGQDSQERRGHTTYAALYVPVCVLSMPYWDICLDHGVVGDPQIRTTGYQTSSYPHLLRGSFERTNLTTLIVARSEIAALVAHLDHVFVLFRDRIQKHIATWQLR